MTSEEIIRELTNVEEQYKNKPAATFEVNISSMARGCRKHIEELVQKNDRLKADIDNLQTDKNALAHNVVMLGNIIREKEGLWGELEKRFVTVEKVCTEEEKAKCPMFPEFCEGSCKERIDLVALLDKACEGGKVY